MGSACSKIKQMKDVKKILLFHHALLDDMAKLKSNKLGRKKLRQALSLEVTRKYRCVRRIHEATGVGRRLQDKPFHKKKRLLEKSKAMQAAVQLFLERDDNSRMSSSKKDHVHSKQIRFLLHSLKPLHKKYLSEMELKVSLAYFCRKRPIHICKPTLKDRDVCVCKQCENFTLKLETLSREKIVLSRDPVDFTALLVCDTNNQDCMYSNYKKCARKAKISDCDVIDKVVEWWEWNNVNHTYTAKDGGMKSTRRTQKVRNTTSLKALITSTNTCFSSMKKHLYRVYHKYATIASLKNIFNVYIFKRKKRNRTKTFLVYKSVCQ